MDDVVVIVVVVDVVVITSRWHSVSNTQKTLCAIARAEINRKRIEHIRSAIDNNRIINGPHAINNGAKIRQQCNQITSENLDLCTYAFPGNI